jgi:mitogen-activated protein kinase 1/3
MLQRKPLFPGDNYRHVLRLITKVTGSVAEPDLWFVTNPNAKAYMLHRLPVYRRVDFSLQFPAASPHAADLLGRMLEFDFAKRISVDDALAHPYFADIRDPAWEMEASPGQLQWGDIDAAETTRLQMQRIIMEDAARLNPANEEVLAEIQQRCREREQAAVGKGKDGGGGSQQRGSSRAGSLQQQQGGSAMPLA